MNQSKQQTGNWNTRLNQNTRRLAMWTGAWLLSMALATFGPELLWESKQGLTLTAILVNLAIGLGMILANIRHLQVLDEMMQKIQLQAMGLALGVGVVGGLAYSLLDVTDIIASDAEISYLVILMAVTYLVSVMISHRRYQ